MELGLSQKSPYIFKRRYEDAAPFEVAKSTITATTDTRIDGVYFDNPRFWRLIVDIVDILTFLYRVWGYL